jgi:hypothetical protein
MEASSGASTVWSQLQSENWVTWNGKWGRNNCFSCGKQCTRSNQLRMLHEYRKRKGENSSELITYLVTNSIQATLFSPRGGYGHEDEVPVSICECLFAPVWRRAMELRTSTSGRVSVQQVAYSGSTIRVSKLQALRDTHRGCPRKSTKRTAMNVQALTERTYFQP